MIMKQVIIIIIMMIRMEIITSTIDISRRRVNNNAYGRHVQVKGREQWYCTSEYNNANNTHSIETTQKEIPFLHLWPTWPWLLMRKLISNFQLNPSNSILALSVPNATWRFLPMGNTYGVHLWGTHRHNSPIIYVNLSKTWILSSCYLTRTDSDIESRLRERHLLTWTRFVINDLSLTQSLLFAVFVLFM